MTTTAPTLLLGGTGRTGSRVAQRLTARGLPVRVASRTGTPPFDWDDPATWPALLDGAGAVYAAYSPDLAVPGAAETVARLAAAATDRGIERFVLLSGRGEPAAQAAEEAVRAALPSRTVVRASWFLQNFSEGFLVDGLLAGRLELPVDGVREPFVDADDIADVAVAALTEDGHAGTVHELTGPRLLTFAEVTDEIATATGRPLAYAPISSEEFARRLDAAGVPADVTGLLGYLFTEVLDGRNAHLTDGVERALGRPARDVRDYARSAAATGVWDV